MFCDLTPSFLSLDGQWQKQSTWLIFELRSTGWNMWQICFKTSMFFAYCLVQTLWIPVVLAGLLWELEVIQVKTRPVFTIHVKLLGKKKHAKYNVFYAYTGTMQIAVCLDEFCPWCCKNIVKIPAPFLSTARMNNTQFLDGFGLKYCPGRTPPPPPPPPATTTTTTATTTTTTTATTCAYVSVRCLRFWPWCGRTLPHRGVKRWKKDRKIDR